jgi:hypothetical protein
MCAPFEVGANTLWDVVASELGELGELNIRKMGLDFLLR